MIIPHSRPSIDQSDIDAVSEVLASGKIAQGEKVREFENALARYAGVKHGVAVSSGTSALHLALLSLGIGPRDQVIIPSYVCSSPYFAVLYAGAAPEIVDVDLTNFNIHANAVKPQISPRTKAIIVPHMFGNPAELGSILELGIPVIEDCAQSIGAEYKSHKVGSLGKVSVFSFYATKMMTTGEGGMILTDDDDCFTTLLELRDYDGKALHPVKYNYKMTDLQASLGLSQLSKLPGFIECRRRIALAYTHAFSKYEIQVPIPTADSKAVFYRYVVTLEKMEQFRERAHKEGIICEKPLFTPLHRNLTSVECKNSDLVHSRALSIPLYPSLSQEEIDYLLSRLEEILGRMAAKSTVQIPRDDEAIKKRRA